MSVGLFDSALQRKAGSAARTATPSRAGDLPGVEGFEVISLLGEGGMGKVFKARQTSLDRLVALKILSPAFSSDAEYVERFHREAVAAGELRHPNIVSVIDHGLDPASGVHFIAFEFVDGLTLGRILARRKRLPEQEALAIVRAVASALACAEDRRIVHRDIKPDNVIVAPDGTVRLVDLGLARKLEDESHLTMKGVVIGTPQYMAPEQALGVDAIDHRADLYSLGLVLYKLLTGKLAFTAESAVEYLVKHIHEDCPDPRIANPAISEATAEIMKKLAARKREDRYASARDAIRDIDFAVTHRPGSAPRIAARALDAAPVPVAPVPTAAAPDPKATRSAGRVRARRTRTAILAGAASLAVVAFAFFLGMRRPEAQPVAPDDVEGDTTQLLAPAMQAARVPAPPAREPEKPGRVEPASKEQLPPRETGAAEPAPVPTSSAALPAPAPSEDPGTAPPPAARVEPRSTSNLGAARAAIKTLDLERALALLEGDASREANALRSWVLARQSFLDSLGASVSGAKVFSRDGRRLKVRSASSSGVQLEDGSSLSWDAVPRGSLVELVLAAERSSNAPSLGATLVLHDLGSWSRGDQRLKAWLDSEPSPGRENEAFSVLARARGSEAPETFVFREGEWLTRDEERLRTGDLVHVDGREVTRDEARKALEKQRKTRAPAKKEKPDEWRTLGVTDVRTLSGAGNPEKRIDVVIVSDGFAQAQVPSFEQAADAIAAALPTLELWKSFAHAIAIHRITVVEERAGSAKTRLGSRTTFLGGVDCDPEAARRYARLAPDADLVIVCANVPEGHPNGHAGSPGVIAMDGTGRISDGFLREVGYAFAGLDDEVDDDGFARGIPDFDESEERAHANVTRQSNPDLSKWRHWLRPPLLPGDQKVGCFEGAYYRTKGYYRPCQDCKMRSSRARRFCPVCQEQLAKSFYQCLDPLDDASPRSSELALWKDESLKLSATAPAIEGQGEDQTSAKLRWFLDGRPVQAKSVGPRSELALPIPGSPLAPGEHQVALRVELRDSRVRRDDGLLASSRAWRLRVLEGPRPRISAPERVAVKRGELVAFDVTADRDLPLVASGPEGSTFSFAKREGRFVWTPGRGTRGAFRAVFSCGEGPARQERTTEIDVLDDREVAPVLADPGPLSVTRGETLTVTLSAFDADKDGLLFSSRALPPGAELDAVTGVLRFSPGVSSSLPSELEVPVRVSDGKLHDEIALRVKLESRPIAAPGSGLDLLAATRSPSREVRAKALAVLAASDLPSDAKLLELARLLRDADPEIGSAALDALGKLPGLENRRGLLAIDLCEHAWDLDDRPAARAFLSELAKGPLEGEAKTAAARLQKDLAAIEKWSKDRGAR